MVTLLAMHAILLITAASAAATPKHVFKEDFGSANKPAFGHDEGLAVDQSTGDLLVIDASANTVSRWHADGTAANFSALGTNVIDAKKGAGNKECAEEAASCDANPSHLGFSFGGPNEVQIAVDNSGTATDGDIYVAQAAEWVDVFSSTGEFLGQLVPPTPGPPERCGVAVASNGHLFVADFTGNPETSRIYEYSPSANPPTNSDLSGEIKDGKPGQIPCALAAGAGPGVGSLFATDFVGGKVRKFAIGSGKEVGEVSSGGTTVSVDPATGYLYVAKGSQVRVFDASGAAPKEPEQAISAGGTAEGVAVHGADGNLYVSRSGSANVSVFGVVLVPTVVAEPASAIGETTATLNGSIDPEGVPVTECVFDWGKVGVAYEHSEACAETPGEIGTSAGSVHLALAGLESGVKYHYRLRAKNANGEAPSLAEAEDTKFATLHVPVIGGAWADGAIFTEATVKAELNPKFYATSYHAEYLTQAQFEANGNSFNGPASPSATPDAVLATEDDSLHTVDVRITGLAPGTGYRWRLVATSAGGTTVGPVRTFATYGTAATGGCANEGLRSGPAHVLADCRAYEMVSPVDKNGGSIVNNNNAGGEHEAYIQSTPDGNKITYSAAPAFGDEPSAKHYNQYLASRNETAPHEGGWANHGVNAPLGAQLFTSAFYIFNQAGPFSEDLCSMWLVDYNATPLEPDAQAGYANLYRRSLCGGGEGYETLTTGEPPVGAAATYVQRFAVEGFSSAGDESFFVANAKLPVSGVPAAAGATSQLYVRYGGGLRLVSVLPSGGANATNNGLGGAGAGEGNLQGAVSGSGTRAYWTGGIDPTTHKGKIYLRYNPTAAETSAKDGSGNCDPHPQPELACTVPVSEGSLATFWQASPDGSAALYSEGDLGGGAATLYRYDAASGARTPIAEGVRGVAGASDDLSRIYLVSTKVLSGPNGEGKAPSVGQQNLYLAEGGGFTFIGTLTTGDTNSNINAYQVTTLIPRRRGTRVSDDGRHLAFVSRAQLTGFDNTDATSGETDAEVFVYDAGGGLRCASCNPAGARPKGAEYPWPYVYPAISKAGGVLKTGVHAAAWFPTWENPQHASNVLSQDGTRVFFNSFDNLVPGDRNGVQDVYEWEAPGAGSCRVGGPGYSAVNGGCVSLVSSGESKGESEFWEAGADGRDVFFTTDQSLVPQDPGLVDLYDARVEGGFLQPGQRAICEGDACQSPPAAPANPTPASSAYNGAGNLKQKGNQRCPKGKHRVRRNGKARCLKQRHGKRRKHRTNHHRRAGR